MAIEHLISTARATREFKEDMARYAHGTPVERIQTVRHAPRVKVLRVLAQLLSEEPGLEVDRVAIDGWSGCSDFRGTIAVTTPGGVRTFRFHWDCSWRAEQEGWFDAFQLPDQIRAAREFGWQCFSHWEAQPVEGEVLAPDAAAH